MSGGFDSMSGFGQGVDPFGDTAPLSSSTTQPPPPPSSGSNRDSLNLDDFEKVEADDHMFGGPPPAVTSTIGNVAESTQAAAVGLVDDIMAKVTSSGEDLFSSFTATGLPSASEAKADSTTKSDPFKLYDMDDDFGMKPPASSGELISSSDNGAGGFGMDIGVTGVPPSESFTTDLLASAPPPPSNNLFDDLSPKPDEKPDTSAFDDFFSKNDDKGGFFSKNDDKGGFDSMSDLKGMSDFSAPDIKGMLDFSMPEVKETVKEVSEPLFESMSSFSAEAPLFNVEPVKRDPSPEFRNPTPPRTPTAPLQEDIVAPKKPSPPRTPTPPPREPSPPPKKEPTPPPKEPSPPPRQPTPPRTPTPPPREPTPPPREPTPPPREPTPPPREPTPPPREPTPPPREPTPPPREPTPPPKVPTPPPREPTPPPKEPTPPREPSPVPRTPTPPPLLKKAAASSAPIQEAIVSPGKSYKVSASTEKAFNVFKPLVDLIYWRDVKKTGIVFGSLMVILLSLAYLSLISVVAYSSLAVLTGTITFRVYKNIMQAVQKSQDGHPFKCILEMDTDLPTEKVHEATDVIVSQINSTVSELKRLFLVEDLVDSVKFGCLLWCLTYVGSWFNGLTLVILAVVALFSLPKVYEQNQAQIDQYVGLVRSQVNDVMSKVKAALPIGNKEKTQ